MVKRQRRLVDLAIFLGPLMLTLAVPCSGIFLGKTKEHDGKIGKPPFGKEKNLGEV